MKKWCNILLTILALLSCVLFSACKDDKYKNELQNAIEQDYVHKFYIACKL